MIVGIVQHSVGDIGGNDKILDSLFEVFKEYQIELFTFSKTNKILPNNVRVHIKVPFIIPFFGIYKKLLMPQHDYSICDFVISATGQIIKTDKPLIIYDQNNLAAELNQTIPKKYHRGLWRLYYLPYKLMQKDPPFNAKYVFNSKYSRDSHKRILGDSIIYPPVKLDEFYTSNKKQQICVIGRISPEKNLEQTIKILNKIEHRCIIFGNVTPTNIIYYEKLKSQAHDHIIFMINKPRHELLKLLAESKIIFTSSQETFGITTVEGIASGCIPVVPNNSAHPETVPVSALRYDTPEKACIILDRLMADNMPDNYMTKLKDHIRKFSFQNFKNDWLGVVNEMVN